MYNQQIKTKNKSLLKRRFLGLHVCSVVLLLGMYTGNAQAVWKATAGGQFYFSQLNTTGNASIESSFEPSGGITLGVSRSFNDNWSLHSGIELSYQQARTSINSYSDSQNAVDIEGESFEFIYELNNYSEKIQSTVLAIPLSVQYESNGSQTRFYTKLGASANFFLSPKATGKASSLTTSGFYERFNGTLTAPRFAGFGTFSDIEFAKNNVEIENSYNAFLELGVKEKILANNWIYVGIYAAYGLNNLAVNNATSLVQYNSNVPLEFINNSVLNASDQSNGAGFVDKINLNIIGVRVYYEFGI